MSAATGSFRSSAATMGLFLLVTSCASTNAETTRSSDAATAGEEGAGSVPDGSVAQPEGGTSSDDGPLHCSAALAGGQCPHKKPMSMTIIGTTYSTTGSTITYGTAPDQWDVYESAGPGQRLPTVVASAGALSISATLQPIGAQAWSAVGVSAAGPECIDETNVARGVNFTLSGDLGGCLLSVDAVTSRNQSAATDPCRGTCTADAVSCIASSRQITQTGMIFIQNMLFDGGHPNEYPDTSNLIGFRWRLSTPDGAANCSASITIADVALAGI